MTSGDKSVDLERQIERIHRALCATDAEVTWNDRIIDPDNPGQFRQIDVTIRRGGHLTVVECRSRKAPQDVMWVEELYGRRVSLRADAIIGVSSSGFTDGAQKKAEAFGIPLRELASVSPQEARNWGEASTLWIVFYEFRDCRIIVPNLDAAQRQPTLTQANGQPVAWRELLLKLAEKYDLNSMGERFVRLTAKLRGNFFVANVAISEIELNCRMRGRKLETEAPSVRIYSNPNDTTEAIEARVDKFPVGQSEIIKGSQIATIILDLSTVKIPTRSIFGFAGITQPDGIRVRDVRIIGIENMQRCNVDVLDEYGRHY